MKIAPVKAPRFGITARVYLWILVMALILLAIGVATWVNAGDQATMRAAVEIDLALAGFQSEYARQNQDMLTLGNWLAGQRGLVDLVRLRDAQGLAQFLEPLTRASNLDVLAVYDAQGALLAQVRLDQPPAQGEPAGDDAGVRRALSGQSTGGLHQDRSGRVQGRVLIPVYVDPQHAPAGVLMLGFFLDGRFLEYAARRTGTEVAVVYQDRFAASTLSDPKGNPWTGLLAPAVVLVAQREGRPSELLTSQTGKGSYLFKFTPFKPGDTATEAMYGVGINLASIDAQRWALVRSIGLGLFVFAAGMCVVGYVFARALIGPIRSLDRAAQAMAAGDLSAPIDLPRDDELGDLARQMESMRRQLQQALQSATLEKTHYAAVIQSMGAAAMITDHDHRIAGVNAAAEALLREGQAGLLGRPWQDVFAMNGRTDDTQPAVWNHGASTNGGPGLAVRARFPLRARPQLVLDVISTPVELEGQPAGYVHILQDVSAQEQFARSKDEFIMNVAHELRGPLASLRASIELLTEDYASMSRRDLGVMLRTLQRGVVKFQVLVENLIDIGNLQAGRFRVRPVTTPLGRLVQDAVGQVDSLLQTRGQALNIQMGCPPDSLVFADRARAMQVIINLLTNASKYAPENEPVSLSIACQDGFVRIEVSDRGPGIPLEEQTQVFKRFFRAKRVEQEGAGVGLGLALAKAIVEAHGGQIDLLSAPGQGTTVWFTLPLAQPVETTAEVQHVSA